MLTRICALLLASMLLGACGAPCGDACRKLVNQCGYLDPWEDIEDCITECEGVRENFIEPAALNDYDQHVRCLVNTTCNRLDEEPEVCGDPQLVP